MTRISFKNLGIFAFTLLSSASLSFVSSAQAGDTLQSLITEGEFTGQIRYRYEHVDQDGPAPVVDEARASTVRTNLGFKTGKFMDFQALLEAQLVKTIGANDFNDAVNGQTNFPVVADADNNEINQAWITYTGLPGTEFKLGRQAMNLDNERFIGTSGWRQNDQTFDSAMVTYTGLDRLTLQYAYIWNVNRIFGDDHPLGDLDSESHIIRAGYKFTDWLNVMGYGYLLDFDRLASSSSSTYGLRASGEAPLGEKVSFVYEAEWAHQNDRGNNPASTSENYYHISPGIKIHGLTAKIGYEELGGNGTSSFQTPLGTLHKFNGWADKFGTTPAAGLEDSYVMLSYKLSDVHEWLNNIELTGFYHDFSGDESGDFGSEIDLSIGRTFKFPETYPFTSMNLTLKYSDYDAEDAPYTDTQKTWFQMTLNF
ncbi:MAG: alginate export family protein [Alphaproteobacteria bacterium]|nr:alginate export family protein [Alphaproteobacteria bacterium]